MRHSSKFVFVVCSGLTLYILLNLSLDIIEYLTKLTNKAEETHYKDVKLLPLDILLSPSVDYCNDVKFLITVHTNAADTVRRDVIRMSYGTPSLARKFGYKFLFPLGVPEKADDSLMERLVLEHKWNGDLLQSDFIDSYKNITLKQLSHFRFFDSHCSDSTFLLKLDDDVAWNIEKVGDYISHLQNDSSIDCLKWRRMKVMRNKNSKWFVPPELYAPSAYPEYCSGMAYIAGSRAVKKMVTHVKDMTIFWVDDVFMTGMLRIAANVTINNISAKYKFTPDVELLKNGTVYFALLPRKASMLDWFQRINNHTLQQFIH